jgi:hypothetical protein
MTQYLLSVHHRESDPEPSAEAMQKAFRDVDALNAEMRASGTWVFGGGLMPVSTATVVDATGTEVVMVHGPFVRSADHLGGFWVVEAKDEDEALDLARRASRACLNPVEVRPFQD